MLIYFTREKKWLLPFSMVYFYLAVAWLQVIGTNERQKKKKTTEQFLLCVSIMAFNIFFPFNFSFTIFCVAFFASNFTFHSVGVVARAPPGPASPPSPLTAAKAGSVAATLTAAGGSQLAADPLRLSHSLAGRQQGWADYGKRPTFKNNGATVNNPELLSLKEG